MSGRPTGFRQGFRGSRRLRAGAPEYALLLPGMKRELPEQESHYRRPPARFKTISFISVISSIA
jgi:hypothetical protein